MGAIVSVVSAVAGVASVLEAGEDIGLGTILGAGAGVLQAGIDIGGAAGMKHGMAGSNSGSNGGELHTDPVTKDDVQNIVDNGVSNLENFLGEEFSNKLDGFIDDSNAVLLQNITTLLDITIVTIEDFVQEQILEQTIDTERGELQAFILFFMNEYLAFVDAGEPMWTLFSDQLCGYHWQGYTDSFDTCQNLCYAEGIRHCAGVLWNPHEGPTGSCKLINRGQDIGKCDVDSEWNAYRMEIIPTYDDDFLSARLAPYEQQLYNVVSRLQQDDVKNPGLGLFALAATAQFAYFQELAIRDPDATKPEESVYTRTLQNLAKSYLDYAINQGSNNLASRIQKNPKNEDNIRTEYYDNFLLPVLLWEQLISQPLPDGEIVVAPPIGDATWTLSTHQYCNYHYTACTDIFSQCQNLCFLEGREKCAGILVSPASDGGAVPKQWRCPTAYACKLVNRDQTIGQCTGNSQGQWDAYKMTIYADCGLPVCTREAPTICGTDGALYTQCYLDYARCLDPSISACTSSCKCGINASSQITTKSTSTWIIVVSVVCALALCVLIGAFAYSRTKKRDTDNQEYIQMEDNDTI